MLTTIYNALSQIIGAPTGIPQNNVISTYCGLFLYATGCLVTLLVISFVCKFVLKLVER